MYEFIVYAHTGDDSETVEYYVIPRAETAEKIRTICNFWRVTCEMPEFPETFRVEHYAFLEELVKCNRLGNWHMSSVSRALFDHVPDWRERPRLCKAVFLLFPQLQTNKISPA